MSDPLRLSAEEDLQRLLKAIEKLSPWVRPPIVRSVAGIHRGNERLLTVKSHRWDTFMRTVGHVRDRHPKVGGEE